MNRKFSLLFLSAALFSFILLLREPLGDSPSNQTLALSRGSAGTQNTAVEGSVPESSAAPNLPERISDASRGGTARVPSRSIVAYALKGEVVGTSLTIGSFDSEGKKGVSQRCLHDSHALAGAVVGDSIELALPGGALGRGEVLVVQHGSDGKTYIGGRLKEGRGGFVLEFTADRLGGHVLLEDKRMAYTFEADQDNEGHPTNWVVQRKIGDVICESIPLTRPDSPGFAAAPSVAGALAGVESADFESFAGAEAVAYVDFDGGVVADVAWTRFNRGQSIDAQPQLREVAEKLKIARWVAEDFYPFAINVTTKRSVYDAAPPAKRMRCIVTSTNFRGSGGVAFLNSFGQTDGTGAGKVCWAFNEGMQNCATTISHEIGHTFGLNHDGRKKASEVYFSGFHGVPIPWGPIMGASFDVQMDQWSKGEYEDANNAQDDLAVISSPGWGVGFRADDAGDTRDKAAALSLQREMIKQQGGITNSKDVDYYVFSSLGGDFNATVSPAAEGPNLDAQIQVEDFAGKVLASSAPENLLSAAINVFLQPGVYYLRVGNSGNRDPQRDGYSGYGSMGSYVVSGSMRAIPAVPVVTGPGSQEGVVGTAFRYGITATNSPTVYAVSGTLPLGLSFSSDSGEILGKPQKEGAFTVNLHAGNDAGTGTKGLTIRIAPSPTSLAQAVNQPALPLGPSGKTAWFVDAVYASDGVASAASGQIGHAESSGLVANIAGPTQLTFKWACSTEAGDKLKLFLNGNEYPAAISGERSWTTLSVDLPGQANKVEWRYVKDANLSAGADTAWVDALQIGAVPRITAQQGDLTVREGDAVQLRFESFGATAYQWFKNGQSFAGAATNRTVAGGRVETVLNFEKVQTGDEGEYTVQISNAFGTLRRTAKLLVEGPLAIVQSPQNTLLSEGRSGALYLRVSGGSALNPPKVEWLFNGLPIKAAVESAAAKWGLDASMYSLKEFSDPSTTGLYILSFDPAYLFEEGEYSAKVSSNTASLLSRKARLQVVPTLAYQLPPQSKPLGGAHSWTINTPTTVRGNSQIPLGIEWLRDLRPLPGKTSATLNLTNLQIADGGSYSVRLRSALGGAPYVLGLGRLTVGVPPLISKQPVSVNTMAGRAVQLSVSFTGGTAPIQAQWFKNGQPLQGGTGLRLTFQSVELADSGNYFVRLSNAGGTVESQTATLTIKAADLAARMLQGPVFGGQHFDFTWCPDLGGWAALTEVTQAQYFAVMKATSPSVFRGSDRPADSVTWAEAFAFSQKITQQARSAGWLPKAWEFVLPLDSEWAAVAGTGPATGEIFGRSGIQGTGSAVSGSKNASGLYGVHGNVAEWGRSTSPQGRSVLGGAWDDLSLEGIKIPASSSSEKNRNSRVGFRVYLLYAPEMDPLVITSQPLSQSLKELAPVNLSVATKGGRPPYRYQWRRNGVDLPGATASNLKFSASVGNAGDYQVLIFSSSSWLLSGTASLSVVRDGPPQTLRNVMNQQPIFEGVKINFAWVPNLSGWFGQTEVTQRQFNDINYYNPSAHSDPEKPVENLSWDEANAFCERLNAIGRGGRWLPKDWAFVLPSEAEYAYLLPRVDPAQSVLGRATTKNGPEKVASLAASPDGLFDVRGNVREWCRNWSDASKVFKVLVGGSCADAAGDEPRIVQGTGVRQLLSGFRVALVKIGADSGVPPSITRIPESIKVKFGAAATFSGAASGTPPLAVQWFKDGVAIPGATTFKLTLPKVSGASSGNYAFQVSNAAGVTRSAAAVLTIQSGASVDSLFLRLAKPSAVGPATFDFARVDPINGWALRSEVTQDQFLRLMGKNPSGSKNPELPVHNVAWEDARAFCDRLSATAAEEGWLPVGWMFALPSESEWEGISQPTPTRIRAGYYNQSVLRTAQDASGDETGFYNLFGNVSEWTRTWYDSKRVARSVRGGSVGDAGTALAPVVSWSRAPGEKLDTVGFRVVLVENPSNAEAQANVVSFPEEASLEAEAGQTLRLSVKVTSAPGGVAYQWLKDGQPILGAQSESLQILAGGAAEAGFYTFKLNGVTLAGWNVSVSQQRLYHVSVSGSDASGDGTLARPLASIQTAIQRSNPGDGILVYPGTYTQSLVIDKALEIRSSEGPRKTVIKSSGRGSAVFVTGANVDAGKLVGFTLTGGAGFNSPGARDGYGGGFELAAPTGVTYEIRDSVIGNNNSSSITFGGGFHVASGGTLLMNNSLVHNNSAWASGGTALIEGSNFVADRCTFVGNNSDGFNRIGGISAAGNCDIKIKNSILWNNTSNQYGSFSSGPSGTGKFDFSYSIVQGGTTGRVGGNTQTAVVVGLGNLSLNPRFADTVAYGLAAGSPAIDAGDPATRDADGSRADMGFSESGYPSGTRTFFADFPYSFTKD